MKRNLLWIIIYKLQTQFPACVSAVCHKKLRQKKDRSLTPRFLLHLWKFVPTKFPVLPYERPRLFCPIFLRCSAIWKTSQRKVLRSVGENSREPNAMVVWIVLHSTQWKLAVLLGTWIIWFNIISPFLQLPQFCLQHQPTRPSLKETRYHSSALLLVTLCQT